MSFRSGGWTVLDRYGQSGTERFFPLVSAPGQCRTGSAVLVQRKTGFRASRCLSDMTSKRAFALHVGTDMQRKRENLYMLPRLERIYPAFIENWKIVG